jgi:phosphopantothenoylcysteine decarboxylase/phosphopantothenate--cysteine ligase
MSQPASTPADLEARRLLVYVGGSVAAHKAGDVITLLRRRGAEVRVAMTAAATRFVGPVTLQSLSGHPVVADLWQSPDEGHGMEHLSLSAWAEVQLCVAASADLIARLALGLADDAVTTTALACRAPMVIAPAMETAMWEHPATVAHVETLRRRGAVFAGPVPGRLASGRQGIGRMAEPADIVEAAVAALH